ncbi:leucyl/phenylalanyl-tRNA--protein transferase [Desulfoprunum benzoelyticum]|uniref:Leucyl/phenylalanyl-tRNA--protein transferase n=1 Tax=Desulfoprunum benzoelyticum TaxID=1506996 RepID=A0A840UVS6_9BACT|nr:leucyl/phenylalanyl-tRNA--protein transferase [Desulfoprunum benzoelyticum]MBB5348943.1 leucyl/phenylalanyl-tRNA--protein transferase [Desulfoprunum benzoelyticum]MBM9530805.1 leucyl/phenylalanyl-tRNA--protein transferase [Desulfoprunum benzoelyticum]
MPVFRLSKQVLFPPPELAEESGLVAVGGDLSSERLIAAYSRGIFPWYGEGDPILWWFTSPRLVLFPSELRVSRRLARYLRTTGIRVTVDAAFSEVIGMCADIRTDTRRETWISTEMQQAYVRLHDLGYAHSVECWSDGGLVGGLYGVALDRVFFGESMFSTISNASKIGLIHLVARLRKRSFQLIDCQMTTQHLLRLGAREITGERFSDLLRRYIQSTAPDGNWNNDTKKNS